MGQRLPSMARPDLRRVAKARRRLDACRQAVDDAQEELFAAIKAAVASGEAYRDVARMAGLTHQRVAQIIRRGDGG